MQLQSKYILLAGKTNKEFFPNDHILAFSVVLLFVWVVCLVFFFLLFVNGSKQLNLLFICGPFVSGFVDIPKFNGNICQVGWVSLLANVWGNGWLNTDVRLGGFC